MKKFRPPQNFFEDILNNITTSVGVLAPDGKILFVNNTALEIIRTRIEDVQEKMFYDVFWSQHSDETRQKVKNSIKKCAAGKSVQMEVEVQTANGSLRWIDYNLHPISDKFGKVKYIVSESRDITSKKNAERAKAMSESRYRKLLHLLPLTVFKSDKKGDVVFANQPALKTFGYTTGDIARGLNTLDLIAPEDRQKALNHFIDVFKSKKSVPQKYLARKKDGAIFPVLYHASALTVNGKSTGVIGFAVDISDTEKKQRELEILLECIEQASESIVITDSNAIITYVNPSFEKISGYSKEEAIGQNPKILQSKKHDPSFYKAIWDTLGKGEVWSGYFFNKKKDGTLYEESSTISPIIDKNTGKIINYIAVKKDVTRERETESMLRQSQRLEIIGTLTGGIAHDFNNFLYIISGNIELLKDQARPEDKKLLQQAHSAAQRGVSLIKKILAFSRKAEYNFQPTNLNDTIKKIVPMLNQLVPKSIEITLDLAEDLYIVNHCCPVNFFYYNITP